MNLQDKWLIILIIFVVVFGAFGLAGHMLFDNDDEIIVDNVEINEEVQKNEYTEEELYIMSHLIMGEASGKSWVHKEAVGSVVLNRVADDRFPDNIHDVVFQKGQYACTWDGNYNKEPDEETIEVAKYLLENGSQLPENIVWAAQFKQGKGVYVKIDNTYFCY